MFTQSHDALRKFFKISGAVLFLGFGSIAIANYTTLEGRSSEFAVELMWGDLEGERLKMIERCRLKHLAISELAGGQLNLKDAMTICLEIDRQCPLVLTNIRSSIPGITDSEKEARWVAHFAYSSLQDQDARILLANRLNEEFSVLFPDSSSLSLPAN
jgi:hypothetical protein